MNQRILVGIATRGSLSTRSALETASLLLARQGTSIHLIVIHVIPVLVDTTPRWGRPLGTMPIFPPTPGQLSQARQTIQWAREILLCRGIALDSMEFLLRAGDPADELDRIAREREVDLLVLGRHRSPFPGLLRHVLPGGTTRRLLRRAPPYGVLLGRLLDPGKAEDLASWYEQELQLCLLQQSGTFQMFTPAGVARRFARSEQPIGAQELDAAARALERLASRGTLVCQVIQGELRCWND